MTAFFRILLVVAFGAMVSACAEAQFLAQLAKEWDGTDGGYKVGKPYQINGIWYYPQEDYEYDETGIASWYGPGFHRERTANGERYDMNELTAAHRTLPMPSFVQVTNLENGRTLVLRVNDRGPFARGRILDVSRRAAELLGFKGNGTARVRVKVLAKESRQIAASYRAGKPLKPGETPITVASLPKAEVKAESLPPPPGAKTGTSRKAPAPTAPAGSAPGAAPPEPAFVAPTTGKVATVAVAKTRLFIQAGAFQSYENANRVAAVLSNAKIGPVKISSVLVNGVDLFRVRIGPLDEVILADQTLDRAVRAGYSDSRIVVE